MAFKKTLVQRLFNLSRFSTPTLCRNLARNQEPGRIKRGVHAAVIPEGVRLFPPPLGENLVEKLRGMEIGRDKVRLEGIVAYPTAVREYDAPVRGLTVGEVRKVLRASQVEMIRARLKEVEIDWVSYNKFVNICKECCGGNVEQGLGFAKMLDECGSVIVLGNAVCLRPHQEIKTLVRQI